MELLVCIKQVPDTSEIKLDPETNNLIRTGLPSIVNPYDMHALEAALTVKDQIEGSRVTVVTMGPPQAEEALRQCLALGADDAVLVTDRAFGGADTLATSYTIASAIRHIQRTMNRQSNSFSAVNKLSMAIQHRWALKSQRNSVWRKLPMLVNFP